MINKLPNILKRTLRLRNTSILWILKTHYFAIHHIIFWRRNIIVTAWSHRLKILIRVKIRLTYLHPIFIFVTFTTYISN